ncbi:DUF6191 domain-containing protein [Streptomyces sp. NBC_01563]|uniref:DUF6191 domain-containing protein n=1 Tax=Streptomyces sp. NBC_01563 TaxID=2975880 RepID=UPI00386F03AB
MRHRWLSCLLPPSHWLGLHWRSCPVGQQTVSANHRCPESENPLLLATGSVVIFLWLFLFTWVGWQRRRHGGGGASAAEAWGELFHPSQRHVQQERERQLVLRDDAESGAPPSEPPRVR